MKSSPVPFRDDSAIEQLLTAHDVAKILQLHVKKVYLLPISQVRLSDKRVRYRNADVMTYLNSRLREVQQ
jgi:hypothetical protein